MYMETKEQVTSVQETGEIPEVLIDSSGEDESTQNIEETVKSIQSYQMPVVGVAPTFGKFDLLIFIFQAISFRE